MSGETEDDVSGWTVDTLHAHVNAQFADMRRLLDERYSTQTKALDAAFVAQQAAMQTALAAAEKAVTKAEVATEKRFESVNEFRQTVTDIASKNVTIETHNATQLRNDERFAEMQKRLDKTEGGRTALYAAVVIAVMVIGLIVAAYAPGL